MMSVEVVLSFTNFIRYRLFLDVLFYLDFQEAAAKSAARGRRRSHKRKRVFVPVFVPERQKKKSEYQLVACCLFIST